MTKLWGAEPSLQLLPLIVVIFSASATPTVLLLVPAVLVTVRHDFEDDLSVVDVDSKASLKVFLNDQSWKCEYEECFVVLSRCSAGTFTSFDKWGENDVDARSFKFHSQLSEMQGQSSCRSRRAKGKINLLD